MYDDITAESDSLASLTIAELLQARARDLATHTALVGNDGHGKSRKLTYEELYRLSVGLGVQLERFVERTEDHQPAIAWTYANSNALVAMVLHHAINTIGAVSVPINPASSATETRTILERTRAALLVGASDTLGHVHTSVPTWPIDGLDDLGRFGATNLLDRATCSSTPETPSVILFTSGTTGRSKGVVHSHGTALAAGEGWRTAFGLRQTDTYQSMFPIYSGAGLHFSSLACLIAGATYVIDEARPISASLARVEANRSTVYAAVPSIYQYWLAEEGTDRDLSSLRLLDFGGSVMHRTTIEALRSMLPGVALVQTYGLTEAGPGGLYLPPECLDRKLGSIGSVGSGGLKFRVDTGASTESESDDHAGVVGELQFSGPSVMLGYLDDPEGTRQVFDGDWLRTGDLVRVDPEGYVYFVDRLKDLIIRGGFNISSIEVEETLMACPGVGQVAAFGVPHDHLGEVVGVALVPSVDLHLDPAGFREYATRNLARVKTPAWVVIMDELPLSSAGKVLKSNLRSHPGLTRLEDL